MNPRRYPRTMNEAFTRTVDYAASLERPARHSTRKMARIAPIVAVVVVGLVVAASAIAAR